VNFDSGPLKIASITVNGASTTSSQNGDTLTVQLPDKGQALDYNVEIKYSGKPTAGVYFVAARSAYPAHTPVVYTQGQGQDNRNWLPTYDAPDNKTTTDGYITVPKGWHALSNGYLKGTTKTAETNTFHWKMDLPLSTYLISFVAGPYEVGHEKWVNSSGKAVPVDYWVPEGMLSWGKANFGGSASFLKVFSKITGFDYPWVKYAQAAVPDFMFGGMENTSCITQTIRALVPPELAAWRTATSPAGYRDTVGLIAHETAHQWFGDIVTYQEGKYSWLNEGFASFLPLFYTRATKGEEAYLAQRSGAFSGTSEVARLCMLMDKLGEKRFWKAVHDYLETYKYQNATTEKFFAAMSKSAGEDLTPFMKQWFDSKAVPHISVHAEGGTFVFHQSDPKVNLGPEAWIWTGKDWLKKHLTFTPEVSDVRVEVGESLGLAPVIVDPEGHYVLSQDSTQLASAEQRLAIFNALPTFMKVRYVGELQPLDQEVLAGLIADPKNSFYVPSLIGILDESDADLLAKLASSPDVKLRTPAVFRINTVFAESAPTHVLDVLKHIASSDSNPILKAIAYERVMNLTKDLTMAAKAWDMDVFGELYRVASLKFWTTQQPDLARQRALAALDTPLTEPVQLAAIQALGSVKDKPGERVVYNHLAAILKTPAYGERIAAMKALVAYGDPAASKVIEPLRYERLSFIKARAEAALAALAKATSASN
jgi:aminopeptidase N